MKSEIHPLQGYCYKPSCYTHYEVDSWHKKCNEFVARNEFCEWVICEKDFIRNPHTSRLFSNEESMKMNYCCTCGKKIKVVS